MAIGHSELHLALLSWKNGDTSMVDLKKYLVGREEKAVSDTEKAYGGCHNCYGKGYATVNDQWVGHDTDQDIGSRGGTIRGGNANAMKFCACARGRQLKVLWEAK